MKRVYNYLRDVKGMKIIQIDWVLMKKYWKMGLKEDGRGLKQVSHEKALLKSWF